MVNLNGSRLKLFIVVLLHIILSAAAFDVLQFAEMDTCIVLVSRGSGRRTAAPTRSRLKMLDHRKCPAVGFTF